MHYNKHSSLPNCVFQETIAEGLMVSDFDQLKMDNQGLNEKIEDRTEVFIG